MSQFSLLLLLLGVVLASGEDCTDIEDPIKDDARGIWNASRVEFGASGREGKLVPVSASSLPQLPNAFYEGDSYILQYSQRGGKPDVIYFWQGKESDTFEKAASAILAVQLDGQLGGGTAKQVRVEMGEEPAHFLSLFNGTFVTLQGGKKRDQLVEDTDGKRLFKVFGACNQPRGKAGGSSQFLVRTQQVPETKESLNNDDVFILMTPTKNVIWEAEKAAPEEKAAAKKILPSATPVSRQEFDRNL